MSSIYTLDLTAKGKEKTNLNFQLAFINKGLLLHWLLVPSSLPSLLPSLDSALSFDRGVSGAQQLEGFSLLQQNYMYSVLS